MQEGYYWFKSAYKNLVTGEIILCGWEVVLIASTSFRKKKVLMIIGYTWKEPLDKLIEQYSGMGLNPNAYLKGPLESPRE
jgi:hypothetical protein